MVRAGRGGDRGVAENGVGNIPRSGLWLGECTAVRTLMYNLNGTSPFAGRPLSTNIKLVVNFLGLPRIVHEVMKRQKSSSLNYRHTNMF